MIPIERRITVGEDPVSAQARFNSYFSAWLGAGGFRVVEQTPQSITYERRRFYTWQIVVAVLLFPIGLVALVADRRVERLSAYTVSDGDPQSVIILSGSIVPGPGTSQFAARMDEFDPAVKGSAESAASGWYPDPGNPGSLRFWDGSSWTDKRRPA